MFLYLYSFLFSHITYHMTSIYLPYIYLFVCLFVCFIEVREYLLDILGRFGLFVIICLFVSSKTSTSQLHTHMERIFQENFLSISDDAAVGDSSNLNRNRLQQLLMNAISLINTHHNNGHVDSEELSMIQNHKNLCYYDENGVLSGQDCLKEF